jgi:transcriptional regulator with GAF, ATPase, and Fis domain
MDYGADGQSRLDDCVRGLAALHALAERWIHSSPAEVVQAVLAVVHAALHVDLVYARVPVPGEGPPLESAYTDVDRREHAGAAEIANAFARLPGPESGDVVQNPIGSGTLSIVASRIGSIGFVMAGASRTGFPGELDQLLVESAAQQVHTWLRFARLQAIGSAIGSAIAWIDGAPSTERKLPARVTAPGHVAPRGAFEVVRFGGIVGGSQALRDITSQVDLVAPTEATVLMLGESGTGKELFAREIHERSRRAGRPLVKVNCGAIPREMFESEFFGHVRGAFTGALRDRPGRFQLAEKGTIFLDEVGDLPLDLQPKLLRVLQEGQYERVGDDTTRAVDVRVIAATNRDLTVDIRAGRFREDLYYRLSVFPIVIPPLRERREDIAALASHFVARAAMELGVATPIIGADAYAAMARYDWPGNVRELKNVTERAVILSQGGELRLDQVLGEQLPRSSSPSSPPPDEIVPDAEWRRRERANIVAALERANGRVYGVGGAAELLGVKPSTLQSRLRAMSIRSRDWR